MQQNPGRHRHRRDEHARGRHPVSPPDAPPRPARGRARARRPSGGPRGRRRDGHLNRTIRAAPATGERGQRLPPGPVAVSRRGPRDSRLPSPVRTRPDPARDRRRPCPRRGGLRRIRRPRRHHRPSAPTPARAHRRAREAATAPRPRSPAPSTIAWGDGVGRPAGRLPGARRRDARRPRRPGGRAGQRRLHGRRPHRRRRPGDAETGSAPRATVRRRSAGRSRTAASSSTSWARIPPAGSRPGSVSSAERR